MAQQYPPASGPPPTYHQEANTEQYAPPSGPPPGLAVHQASTETYAPPPGPPLGLTASNAMPTARPAEAPPVHDWQAAVPDTSLLPPPPTLGHERSEANNATEREALQGQAWGEQNPLLGPSQLPQSALDAIDVGSIGVVRPRSYAGLLEQTGRGIWHGRTKSSSSWSCISSTIPLYSALAHSPLRSGKSKTVYYEVKISARNRSEVSLALGFSAPPYPTFRLPGWHRGSLAVHGDDGSKFINDMWGGKSFTQPFRPGQTLGIGMTFTARNVDAPPAYGIEPTQTTSQAPIDVQVFFTRNGRVDGQWNLHEEGDAEEDLPVTGLEGWNDLLASVGTFKEVDFEIVFDKTRWMYHV